MKKIGRDVEPYIYITDLAIANKIGTFVPGVDTSRIGGNIKVMSRVRYLVSSICYL